MALFLKTKNEISQLLVEVKYFHSNRLNFTGRLSRIPRVVIGVDAKTVCELNDLWLEKKNQLLANHPIQFQILEEIIGELSAFANYAAKIGQSGIAVEYEKIKKIAEAIYNQKRTSLKDLEERDSVFYAIQNYLRDFIPASSTEIQNKKY